MIPSHAVEALRYVSIIALGTVLLAGVWVLLSAKHGTATSISERLSGNRRQYIIMGLILTLFGAALYCFAYFWFGPTYSLPLAYYIVLVLTYLAVLLVAWIPYNGEPSRYDMHRRAGEAVACSMAFTLIILFIYNHHSLPFFSYWLSLLSIIFSLMSIVLYIFVPKINQHFVIYESTYVLLFSMAIIVLTLKV